MMLSKKVNDLAETVEGTFARIKAEKILQNLPTNDKNEIFRPDRKIITCGKLTPARRRVIRYILFSDCILGFSQNFRGNFQVEEEYLIQNILDVYPAQEDTSFRIRFFSSEPLILTAKNVALKSHWMQKISKTKELWKAQHCTMEIASQMAMGLTPENIAKYWRLHDLNDPSAWILLGDFYRNEEKYKDAANCYDSAIHYKNNDIHVEYKALYKKAKIYAKIEETEEEISCLKQVMDLVQSAHDVDLKLVFKITKLIQKRNISLT